MFCGVSGVVSVGFEVTVALVVSVAVDSAGFGVVTVSLSVLLTVGAWVSVSVFTSEVLVAGIDCGV